MKKSNKKTLVLSIVAFVLILMSLVSFTYSWIDDIKLVEFQNDNLAQNGAPLKTGTDINATVNITKEDNTINLGNMLTNNDLTYEYTENGETKRHIRYDSSSDNSKKPNMDDINEKKGYFYESGDMHLSPCYSNGETFYFQRQGQTGYREGNKDDENVNYISFTAKVSSPDATTDFWFDSMPTIQGKGKDASGNPTTIDVSNYARYAIIVDGECHVYSSNGTANTCNSALTGTTAVSGVRKTSTFTYNDSNNVTAERGVNSNVLFSIKKGGTVNMTIKIWLEGGVGDDVTASNINLKLISSWSKSRKIWIDDKTTNGGGGSWLDDDDANLYVTFPAFLYEKKTNPADWPNIENGPFYPIQASNNKYYVEVPLVYNNEKMILYRCNSTYWNTSAGNAQQRSDYNVYCWNWWQTYAPNTYCDETYTLYGGSMDSTANGYFESISQGFTITNKGYGTWGAVEEIKVFSHYNNNDLATKASGKAMYVVDYSDENTSGETYIYEMYRSGTTSSDPWKTYVPSGSSKIQFRYFGGASGLSWGYNSWNGINPQRRPLASTGLYPINATEYQLGAIFNNVNGWGYWRDTQNHEYDKLYLVKKGSMVGLANHVYDYLYDDNAVHKNGNWPGVEMSRMKDASNNYVLWNDGSSWVMQSDTTRPGSTIYNNVMFNNGGNGNGDKTGTLATFPGCFYNPDDNKWYGAINDVGRASTSGGESGGSGGGTDGEDLGGGSMSGFTTSTTFVFKINGTEYPVKTDGSTYKVSLPLTAGDNWVTVQKKEGTFPEYGNGEAGRYYVTKNNVDLYLTTANSNNFSIRTATTGNFIVAFQNENQDTIKITSILKQG